MHRSWHLDAKTITVSEDGGKIRLGGTVHPPHGRQMASATAWPAPGAAYVEDDITVMQDQVETALPGA